MKKPTLEDVVSFAKRRGFLFQTSSIYGGLANNYDYGPYGTLLKNNIRDAWWKRFVLDRDDMVGLDGAILLQKQVWEASGHVANFSDPLVEDKVSNKRYRVDHLLEAWVEKNKRDDLKNENFEAWSTDKMDEFIKENKILSPDGNELTPAKTFNLMFETQIGATANEDDARIYLRPETAQAIFINFKNVLDSMRVKIPFGIAQVGKAFRNEITKGQFIFRTIETEQMEIEYFISPKEDWESLYEDWKNEIEKFYLEVIGAKKEDLRFRPHDPDELSHYSKQTYDLEYNFDFGFKELVGFAHRSDYDLTQHLEHSGQKLQYRDPYTNEVYVPHVLEPSFGLARAALVAIYAALTEEELENGKTRTVCKFPFEIAPIKIAIFPLQKDEKLKKTARKIYDSLKKEFVCDFDDSGNIGKMYRRQDEIGTPYCITVDFDSLDDQKVTIRDRDTMNQERIEISEIESYINSKI